MGICNYTYGGQNGVAVTGYTGDEIDIRIPNLIDEQPVLAVKADSFGGNEEINSIILPDSMKVIEANAFSGCIEMRCAILNDGLVVIGENAFAGNYGCRELEFTIINFHYRHSRFYNGAHYKIERRGGQPSGRYFV